MKPRWIFLNFRKEWKKWMIMKCFQCLSTHMQICKGSRRSATRRKRLDYQMRFVSARYYYTNLPSKLLRHRHNSAIIFPKKFMYLVLQRGIIQNKLSPVSGSTAPYKYLYSLIWWHGTDGRVFFSHQQYFGLFILPNSASSWNIRRTFFNIELLKLRISATFDLIFLGFDRLAVCFFRMPASCHDFSPAVSMKNTVYLTTNFSISIGNVN